MDSAGAPAPRAPRRGAAVHGAVGLLEHDDLEDLDDHDFDDPDLARDAPDAAAKAVADGAGGSAGRGAACNQSRDAVVDLTGSDDEAEEPSLRGPASDLHGDAAAAARTDPDNTLPAFEHYEGVRMDPDTWAFDAFVLNDAGGLENLGTYKLPELAALARHIYIAVKGPRSKRLDIIRTMMGDGTRAAMLGVEMQDAGSAARANGAAACRISHLLFSAARERAWKLILNKAHRAAPNLMQRLDKDWPRHDRIATAKQSQVRLAERYCTEEQAKDRHKTLDTFLNADQFIHHTREAYSKFITESAAAHGIVVPLMTSSMHTVMCLPRPSPKELPSFASFATSAREATASTASSAPSQAPKRDLHGESSDDVRERKRKRSRSFDRPEGSLSPHRSDVGEVALATTRSSRAGPAVPPPPQALTGPDMQSMPRISGAKSKVSATSSSASSGVPGAASASVVPRATSACLSGTSKSSKAQSMNASPQTPVTTSAGSETFMGSTALKAQASSASPRTPATSMSANASSRWQVASTNRGMVSRTSEVSNAQTTSASPRTPAVNMSEDASSQWQVANANRVAVSGTRVVVVGTSETFNSQVTSASPQPLAPTLGTNGASARFAPAAARAVSVSEAVKTAPTKHTVAASNTSPVASTPASSPAAVASRVSGPNPTIECRQASGSLVASPVAPSIDGNQHQFRPPISASEARPARRASSEPVCNLSQHQPSAIVAVAEVLSAAHLTGASSQIGVHMQGPPFAAASPDHQSFALGRAAKKIRADLRSGLKNVLDNLLRLASSETEHYNHCSMLYAQMEAQSRARGEQGDAQARASYSYAPHPQFEHSRESAVAPSAQEPQRQELSVMQDFLQDRMRLGQRMIQESLHRLQEDARVCSQLLEQLGRAEQCCVQFRQRQREQRFALASMYDSWKTLGTFLIIKRDEQKSVIDSVLGHDSRHASMGSDFLQAVHRVVSIEHEVTSKLRETEQRLAAPLYLSPHEGLLTSGFRGASSSVEQPAQPNRALPHCALSNRALLPRLPRHALPALSAVHFTARLEVQAAPQPVVQPTPSRKDARLQARARAYHLWRRKPAASGISF